MIYLVDENKIESVAVAVLEVNLEDFMPTISHCSTRFIPQRFLALGKNFYFLDCVVAACNESVDTLFSAEVWITTLHTF